MSLMTIWSAGTPTMAAILASRPSTLMEAAPLGAVFRHQRFFRRLILSIRSPPGLVSSSGSVLLSTVVDVDGTPRDITLMRSAGFGLDEKAVEALAQRHFKPGTMNGRPVPVRAQIEVNFRLL